MKSSRTPLFLLLFLFSSLSSFGQSASIRFKAARATPAEQLVYNEHFKAYTLATLSAENVAELLRSREIFTSVTLDCNDQRFVFQLEAKDLRPAHYKLRVATETGIVEYPRSPNKTYAGFTLDGHYDVRITSSEESFYGLILQAHDALYIEPARYIAPGAPKDQYVIYWQKDNLKNFALGKCGTRTMPTMEYHQHDDAKHDEEDLHARGRACKVVQIALADDFRMFDEYGSVAEVEDHNMAVINNVLTNYDFEFDDDLQFDVVEIFVATSDPNDPWSNSNVIDDVLDSFTNWGPNGFDNTHDVGSLWSARNFNGDVIGLAWLNAVCTNFRYNVLEDFTGNAGLLRVLQAHELGHNFSANHDGQGSQTIMAPVVNNSNTWSSASISAINNYINSINCLGPCGTPQPPVAAFEGNPTIGCAPLTVFFDDQSTNNPTSWMWSFPGGTPGSSTSQNPTIVYSAPGSYNVTLTVTNAQGSNSLTIPNYITVGEEPFADFNYQIDNFTVDFDNQSQFGDSYFWNFGDGETSALTNPIHVYDQDGVYTVTLTTTNECGSDSYSVEIEIITVPFADFSSSDPEGCAPFEVDFYNFSSDNADSYSWSFPGGSPPFSTLFEPTVLYENPGTFNVSLTVYNEAGEDTYTIFNYITVFAVPEADFTYVANGLSVSFNSSSSTGDSFLWNFGDGNTSSQENPVHVYSAGGVYTVTLTVTSDCGSDAISLLVNVTSAPVADFSANVEYGCAPLVVQFENTSLGNPTSFNWIFEGGVPGTSTAANPVVTYNTPGLYNVQLTVSNASGNNTLLLTDFIEVEALPLSDFDFSVNGLQATFTNQSQNSTGSAWSFGDGGTSTQTNPVHDYLQDGVYQVMLISTGICGNDTSTAQITIQTLPQAGFTFLQNDFCIPSTVSFTNESSPNATSFAWTFNGGNPSTSTLENPVVTYATVGTFDVTLIAYAPAGSDTMTWTQLVTVGDIPSAAFLISTDGLTVNFQNQSSDGDSYLWLFGDATTSVEISPSHTYPAFGVYTVNLIATNECGNDTMEIVIELSTVPNAFFSYSGHTGCAPFEVQFVDQSQNNPTSWSWTFEGGTPGTSNEQNPLVSYTTPGDYFVSLLVQNGQGSDILVLDDVIHIAGTPDATFNHSQNQNIISLEYPGLDYDSLRWSFGDGRSDNSLNPTVEYTVTGSYLIKLIVYNACGSDTASIIVEIIISGTSDPARLDGDWQVRPNPFHDVLQIHGEPQTTGTLHIILRDAQGKVLDIHQWSHLPGASDIEIPAGHLPAGLILVELKNATARTVLKAVHL